MPQGKFFVIDGQDGTGKATQTRLLVERLKNEGLTVQTISFPQYNTKSAGPLEEYLSGKYGSASDVGPYRASVLYAVDRFDASFKIKQWLTDGFHVIADRYVSSNMGHQGSKIDDPIERNEFFKWEAEFEYGLLGIPKPDLTIILHIPVEISLQLMQKRTDAGLQKHSLETDVHESDPEHMKKSAQAYIDLCEQHEGFEKMICVENENLLEPNIIHDRIWSLIEKHIN